MNYIGKGPEGDAMLKKFLYNFTMVGGGRRKLFLRYLEKFRVIRTKNATNFCSFERGLNR